jgi:hypothetical protein
VQQIGRVLKVQVQRASLKVANADGARHPRRFDPAALLEVDALELTRDGVLGLLQAKAPILDVHNASHPSSKNHEGVNGVSVGFSSHYAAMRDRFGMHLVDGIAGENILVDATQRIDHAALETGLAIETREGSLVRLERIVVAEPCVEFTRFALRLGPADPSSDDVTEGLRFLRAGTRGFYATLAGSTAVVRPGDAVFLCD